MCRNLHSTGRDSLMSASTLGDVENKTQPTCSTDDNVEILMFAVDSCYSRRCDTIDM